MLSLFSSVMAVIVNMTVSATALEKINVERLSDGFVKLKGFKAVKCKHKNVTLMVFTNGKITCVGGKSLSDTQAALWFLEDKLRADLNEPNLKISNPIVRNVVAHYHLVPRSLDLNLLCEYWKDRAVRGGVYFEPELYPALKITFPQGKLLAYHTGKVILTGVTSINAISEMTKLFNDSVSLLLGPHTVVMEGFVSRKRARRQVKQEDVAIAKMLEEIMSEVCQDVAAPPSEVEATLKMDDARAPAAAPGSPPTVATPISFLLCSQCLSDMIDKKRNWRKRLGKHLVTLSVCPNCFVSNAKVFSGKPRPCSPNVADGHGCN